MQHGLTWPEATREVSMSGKHSTTGLEWPILVFEIEKDALIQTCGSGPLQLYPSCPDQL